jgi:hypothetical protein
MKYLPIFDRSSIPNSNLTFGRGPLGPSSDREWRRCYGPRVCVGGVCGSHAQTANGDGPSKIGTAACTGTKELAPTHRHPS